MNRSEYTVRVKRARLWADIAYGVIAISLMLLMSYIGYKWFPQIQALSLIFRDPAMPLANDRFYGAIGGLLISFFLIPSMLLPLLVVIWVHRRLGFNCPHCGASLTILKRDNHVLQHGSCCKCHLSVLARDADEQSPVGLR